MGYPDISKLRVVDLKALCSEYGLEAKGKKAELQAKLLSFFDANPKQATADEDAVEESVAEAAEETAEPVEPELEAAPEEPPVVETKELEVRNEPEPAEPEPELDEEEPIKMETDEPPPLVEPEQEEEKEIEQQQQSPPALEKPASPEKPNSPEPVVEKEKKSRKSRWTETAEVVIGAQLTAPAPDKAPIPRTAEDGSKLTKAQRKKLRKKRQNGIRWLTAALTRGQLRLTTTRAS